MLNVAKKPKYYKYKYSDFVQPILTENGTMGGDSFAVVASSELDYDMKAFCAFDGVNSTSESGNWHSTSGSSHWLNFYNPKQLKISKIIIHNRPSTSTGAVNSIGNFRILNSNDNSNWEQVYSGQNTNNSSKAQIVVDIPDTAEPAKYWSINISSNLETTYTAIGEIEIEAQEVTLIEATKDDYDVIEYEPCLVQGKRTVTYQDFVQPVLTSNTSNPNFVVSTDLNKDGYKAFDGDTARGEATHSSAGSFSNQNHWLQMKTKNGLNITNLAISNRSDISGTNAVTAGSVQVSNNGETWTKITDWTNSSTTAGATWNIPLSYDGYYKYTRLYVTSGYSDNSGNNIPLANIVLTATEEVIEQPVYVIKN